MTRCVTIACVLLLVAAPRAAAQGPFAVELIESTGRTVAAEIADLNGDGRGDLMQIAFVGFPPDERRELRVFLQGDDGSLPPTPSFARPLPPGSTTYDLADLDPEPGEELILLRAEGVLILSLARAGAPERELAVPGGPTLGAVEDERGLDRLKLAWPELGSPPWLIVPQLDAVVVLSPDGELRGRPRTGARANYLIPPRPGPLVAESDIQLFLDVARLSAGDVDGDGAADLVAALRHELRVFLRDEDGRFPTVADRSMPLARVSTADHVRSTGSVRVSASDLDGDGRLDLLISQLSGALLDAQFKTTVHLNRDGAWDLDRADRVFETAGFGTDELVDLDGDGRPELVRATVSFSVLELVEALVTRELDAQVAVHRADAEGFGAEPWLQTKLDLPLSFETGRTSGFLPNVQADLNGDGHRDLLNAPNASQLEVYLGGSFGAYRQRTARQALATNGRIRFGDLERDGMADFLLYDMREIDAPLRVVRNLGRLPGSRPRLTAP